jgi:uncharacterized protein (DUF427 family)
MSYPRRRIVDRRIDRFGGEADHRAMALRMKRHLMGSAEQLRVEPIRQRVRAFSGDRLVVDSVRAMVVWEPRRLVPVFAVPEEDVAADKVPVASAPVAVDSLPPFLGPDDFATHTTPGQALSLRVGGAVLEQAAFRPDDPDVGGRVELDFTAFTRWLEEDQELVGHAHDPFKRIDTLVSSRHVQVSLGGTLLADTRRPVVLLETHLPPRWYLPAEDVRTDLLEPSEHRSTCAYKGHASYFSTSDGDPAGRDIAWTYPEPRHDATPVRGMLCFWAERTDLVVDGAPERRPVTPWSPPEVQRATELDSLELG